MPGSASPREVSEEDKKLSADYRKRIEDALRRFADQFKLFEQNRKHLRGYDKDGKKRRTNLHFANLQAIRPQIYAKNPEFSVKPTKAVPDERLKVVEKFGESAEAVLDAYLVKRARLKKRAKRMLTSAFTTSVGWWKLCWQEDQTSDVLIQNRIKDAQDNIKRLEDLRASMNDPQQCSDTDLQVAKYKQTLDGLQGGPQSEVMQARGLTLDFVMSEDIVVLDSSVLELGDYERSAAMAHGVWMTREQFKSKFGHDGAGAKAYIQQPNGTMQQGTGDQKLELVRVWEVWDQQSNRVLHVCDGMEGFCDPPSTPDWTGTRWYPFFGVAFNEVEGQFYPLSDIELTDSLVSEYNESRDDFVGDRRYALPLNIVRKGGSLTPSDVERISNRKGGDTIVVEGVGGQAISNDIWSGALASLNPDNYNTQPARQDIEQLIGGGDAARGSVLEAKTATEAEILSQGLRGRSAERQDTVEDVLTEMGSYALQVCLRKLTIEEVRKVAGPEAVWPQLTADQVFEMVEVQVKGGSTGKPDRLQEQDRWTKLLPVVEKTAQQVGELRMNGQEPMANALIELTRETLRRFDEQLDLDRFLPPAKEEGEEPQQPQIPPEIVEQAKQLIQDLQGEIDTLKQQLADKEGERQASIQIAEINAKRDVEVTRVKAPIEADAKVEAARITAEAQERAKATENAAKAEREAQERAPDVEPEPQGPSETEQLIAALVAAQAQLQDAVVMSMNKPDTKIVHDRDADGRITESRAVPVVKVE